MKKARIVVLEGTWWSNHEVPLVLPYFQALDISHREIDVSHRTIRSVDDIAYYISRIPRNAGVMLYFACHGERLELKPTQDRERIETSILCDALQKAKRGAISFVHFGCCEMVEPGDRRKSLSEYLEATGARLASGYTKQIDWLESMFLDLALITNVFVPFAQSPDGRVAQLKKRTSKFVQNYEQLARGLGFSALSTSSNGSASLFPQRMHS